MDGPSTQSPTCSPLGAENKRVLTVFTTTEVHQATEACEQAFSGLHLVASTGNRGQMDVPSFFGQEKKN